MPTSGSCISSVIAWKATTIGNVAGADSPSYVDPVARANSRSRSSLTGYGGVGGKVRPAREGSTAMVSNLPIRARDGLDHPDSADPQTCKQPRSPGAVVGRGASAGLAVLGVLAAARAELLQLQAVRVVAAVLLGDVV